MSRTGDGTRVAPRAIDDRRLIGAVEAVRRAAKAAGLDPDAIGDLYVSRAMRADAWLGRTTREATAWDHIKLAPLFSTARAEEQARKEIAHGFPPLEDRSAAVLSPQGGIEYVEDLVRPGRIILLAGEESSGKSTAIRELCIRLACAGGSFAETWPVLATVPVAIGSEMHPDDDYAGEETALASLGKTRADLAGKYFRFSLYDTAAGQPPLMVPAWRAYVSGEVVTLGIRVLIFDTGTTATNVDPWGEKMQEVIGALKSLMTDSPDLAIIVLVHLKKPQGRGERRISDVLGEWGRFTDVVVMIDNDGHSLTRVRITARKRVRRERRIVATKAGGLLVDPQELGDGPAPKVSQEDVVAKIAAHPGITANELATVLEVSRSTAQEYAKAAEQANRIERRDGGPRGALLLYVLSDRPEPSGEHDWTVAAQTVDGGTGEPSDRPTDLHRSDGTRSDGQVIPDESEEELLDQLTRGATTPSSTELP